MKKTNILATTTLAGTLLFNGVNASQANASENISPQQAEENVKNFVTNNKNYNLIDETEFRHMPDKWSDFNKPNNTYKIDVGEKYRQLPSFLYVKKDNGDIYDANGNLLKKGLVSSESISQNDEQISRVTDSTVHSLPETGEKSNSDLVTVVASVLLATGSLLIFRKTFKSK